MKIQEIIDHLITIKEYYTPERDFSQYGEDYEPLTDEGDEAIEMAIEILEALKRKDDLISRQEVLKKLNKLDQQELYLPCHFKEFVIDEVPNIPQKIGRWLYTYTKRRTRRDAKDKDGEQQLEISIVRAKCSVCERWAEQVNKLPPYMTYNFCPYCGTKMGNEKGR